MAQRGTNTAITPRQRQAAEMLVDPNFKGSITELCRAIDVPRRTFYHWRDSPAFCAYLDGLIDKYAKGELASVWKALIRECLGGSVPAMKLYFELLGKLKTMSAGAESGIILMPVADYTGDDG